jgi:hypothetical protein
MTAVRPTPSADGTSSAHESLGWALGQVLAAPFGLVARLRHARAVHPQGFLCTGTWTITTNLDATNGVSLLRAGARYDVIARPSRGAGLPEAIGDFLAVAVRLVDAHGPGRPQDLLMNSSADVPLLHHLFLPAPHWYAQSYSTCLPYTTPNGSLLIGLLPPQDPPPSPSLHDLRDRISRGVVFGIAVAEPFGRWQRIGELRLDHVLDDADGDVDFEPVQNTGGNLAPAPAWLQRLRSDAYGWSRRGRHAPRDPRKQPA